MKRRGYSCFVLSSGPNHVSMDCVQEYLTIIYPASLIISHVGKQLLFVYAIRFKF